MKTQFNIVLLLIITILCNSNYAQNKANNDFEDYYIYISSFGPELMAYRAYFSIDSTDDDFYKETYFFRINYTEPVDFQPLYSLGRRIAVDLDTINLIKPKEYFKGKSYCEIHKELSLMTSRNGKRLIIITDLSNTDRLKEDPDKKYMIWYASYDGSIMADFVWTNMGRKHILEWGD